jgi:hypothetical protein
MAKLSKADAQYLNSLEIDISETFDGSGMTVREIRAWMSSERLLIAYGKPCIWGHFIRAAGGCVRCNPEVISHARRARKSGFVYIAKSAQARLLKIGFSAEDPYNRIYIARCEGYGSIYDWKIRYLVFANNAGRIEIIMKDALKAYHHPMQWIRQGEFKTADEIYQCTLTQAYNALAENLAEEQIQSIKA